MITMLGRNEFALRQGFGPSAQNTCTAHRRRPTVWGPGPVCPRNCPPVPRRSTLILLLLLSKSQPLTLDCDLVRYGAAERPQNGFLFQKEGHDIRRVPLFPSMCQHHMFRFCLVIRIILLFAGIAPDRSPTIGRRPVPGKFPLTKPDSR